MFREPEVFRCQKFVHATNKSVEDGRPSEPRKVKNGFDSAHKFTCLNRFNGSKKKGVSLMKTAFSLAALLMALVLMVSMGLAQTEEQGLAIFKEGLLLKSKAQSRGDFENAMKKLQEALAIFKKTGTEAGQAIALNNIGGVYEGMGQYEDALKSYEQSLQISKKAGQVQGEGANLNNIASVYKNLGKYAKAIEYYEQSLRISKQTSDEQKEATTLYNIGAAYEGMGQYAKALETYEQSLRISKKINDTQGAEATLKNMTRARKNLGK